MEIDNDLISKAVKALLHFEVKRDSSSNKSILIENFSKPILAQIELRKNIEQPIIRPIEISIPHSLYSVDAEGHTTCLFCRSDDKEQIDKHLQSNPISGLTEVISLNQVRKLHRSFQERKKLLSSYSHFVCDERIYSHLCNLLGKTFGNRNNFPLPIRYTAIPKLSTSLSKALSSTYMHLHGKSVSIRLGHTGQTSDQIIDNITQGLQNAIPKFPQHGKSVLSIHLKLSDSPALPIYSRERSDTLEYVKAKAKEISAIAVPDPANDENFTTESSVISTRNNNTQKAPIAVKRKASHLSMSSSVSKSTTEPEVVAIKMKKIKVDINHKDAASAVAIATRGKASTGALIEARKLASALVSPEEAATVSKTGKHNDSAAPKNRLRQALTRKKLGNLRPK